MQNISTSDVSHCNRKMCIVGSMAEAILSPLGPRHQALCRSSGTELAKVFASLVHAKMVPILAQPSNKKSATSRTDSDTVTVGVSSADHSSEKMSPVSPIQIRQVRLPRPLSTIAYINDELAAVPEDEFEPVPNDSSVVVSSTDNTTNSKGGSVCTTFPSELSFIKACRQPGVPATAAYHHYQETIQLSLMSCGTSITPNAQPTPLSGGTSSGTLMWLTDQHTSTAADKLTRNSAASTSHGVSVSGGLTDSSCGRNDASMASNIALTLLHVHLLSMAPVSPTSTCISGIHVVVNVEALAVRPDMSGVSELKVTKTRRNLTVGGIRILDDFCSNLDVQSVDFIGMEKVVTIGNGFLAGSFAESVSFGPMPRLRSVGDDWMFLCSRLSEVKMSGTCDRLRTVGGRWLSECQSLVKFDHGAFSEVERVGPWWLARCESLESASFSGMTSLATVGDWWMSSCPALEKVSFEGQASLTTVGSGWMYGAVSIPSVSFTGLLSLRDVGDRWLADCTYLRSVSHKGLVMLREVGAFWLSGCCMLDRISMLGVDRLMTVGPFWLAHTNAPSIECTSTNSGRITALIDLSHDVLTQRDRIDPKMKIKLLSDGLSGRCLLQSSSDDSERSHAREVHFQEDIVFAEFGT